MGLFSKKPDLVSLWETGQDEQVISLLNEFSLDNQKDVDRFTSTLHNLWEVRPDVSLLWYWGAVFDEGNLSEKHVVECRRQLESAESLPLEIWERATLLICRASFYRLTDDEDFLGMRECMQAMIAMRASDNEQLEGGLDSLLDLAIVSLSFWLMEIGVAADGLDRITSRGDQAILEGLFDRVEQNLNFARAAGLPSAWLLEAWNVALQEATAGRSQALRDLAAEAMGVVNVKIGFNPRDIHLLLNMSFDVERDPEAAMKKLWARFEGRGSIEALAFFLIAKKNGASEDESSSSPVDSKARKIERKHFAFLDSVVRANDFLNRPLPVRGLLLMAWLSAAVDDLDFQKGNGFSVDDAVGFAMSAGASEYVRARQAVGSLLMAEGDYPAAIAVYETPFDSDVLNERAQYFCSNWEPETSTDFLTTMAQLLRSLPRD